MQQHRLLVRLLLGPCFCNWQITMRDLAPWRGERKPPAMHLSSTPGSQQCLPHLLLCPPAQDDRGILFEIGTEICKRQLKTEMKDFLYYSLYLPRFLPVFCPLPPTLSAHFPHFSKPATTVCIYAIQIYYSCKAREPIN